MPARQVQQLLMVATGQWSEVEPMLQAQLNKVSPGQRAEAILQLQQQMSKSNDPAGAVSALQRLTTHDAQRPETHLALARAKVVAKDNTGALSELDTALKLRPGYEDAAILAAELRADSDPDAAISGLRTFLKAAPASIDGHLALARMYLVRNQNDQARAEFEALRKIAPTDPRIPLALGLLNLQQRQYDSAEQYLKEYVAQAAKSPSLSPEPGYQGLAQVAEENATTPAPSRGWTRSPAPRTAMATARWRLPPASSAPSCSASCVASMKRSRPSTSSSPTPKTCPTARAGKP